VFLLLTSGDARYVMDHLPAPMLRNRDAPALLIKNSFFWANDVVLKRTVGNKFIIFNYHNDQMMAQMPDFIQYNKWSLHRRIAYG